MSAYGEWLAYWNGDVSLYVGDTHLAAHYRGLFEDIEPLYIAFCDPRQNAVREWLCQRYNMRPWREQA